MSTAKRIPGPKGHLITGSLRDYHGDMLGFLQRCAREYGDISAFRIWHIPSVLLTAPELIEQVLVRESEQVRKPLDVRQLRLVLGEGLLTSEDDVWRRQRRLIQPAFQHEKLERYAEVMVRRTSTQVDNWNLHDERDVHEDMMRLTLEIVAESLFGLDIDEEADAIARTLELFMGRFEQMLQSFLPLPLAFPTRNTLELKASLKDLNRIVYGFIAKRRASEELGEDFLGRLLAAKEEGVGMTDRQLRDELVTMLLAGHETTAIALSWTLMLLARHPEIETRLLDELRTVLKGSTASAKDLPRLPFTESVIKESMRLYPPAWGVGREATQTIEIGGYQVRKRTQIWMLPYLTHRDRRFFEEPERFRPERWTNGETKSLPKYAYFPFGGGPRKCIGAHFAMMEATLVLATLLPRVHLELDPNHPIELQPAVTLRPRHGIRMRIRPREGTAPSASRTAVPETGAIRS